MQLPRWALAVSLVCVGLSSSSTAFAHPLVDLARQRLEEADFEGSISAAAEAEREGDLTLADYVALLESRALAHLALGDEAGMRTDLIALASIDRNHSFPDSAPPALREAFASARREVPRALGLRVAREERDGMLHFEAVVEDDTASLVRALRIEARSGTGAWIRGQNGAVEVPRTDARVDYFAEALGPGGAVLASDGSRTQPLSYIPEAAPLLPPSGDPRDDDEGGGGFPWLWVGVGAGAVAVTVLVVALAASSGEEMWQVGAPVICSGTMPAPGC